MELVHPVRVVAQACHEGGLQLAVEPLDHAVGLGMVRCGMRVRGAEELVQRGPQLRRELRTAVRRDLRGDTVAGDPSPEECASTGGRD